MAQLSQKQFEFALEELNAGRPIKKWRLPMCSVSALCSASKRQDHGSAGRTLLQRLCTAIVHQSIRRT